MPNTIAIIGSSGAIGRAFVDRLAAASPQSTIYAFSRTPSQRMYDNVIFHALNYSDETSIAHAAETSSKEHPINMVIVATGILHDAVMMPEKSLRDLSAEKFQQLFAANTIVPAIVAKHFLPKLSRDETAIFAALSARVGSVSDNHSGGWYAYRASKAALNMIIKNAALETARHNKNAVVVGLHPGTVDSELSKPFQNHVPDGQLFTPDYAAEKLISVMAGLLPDDSGKCFAWDGQEIMP